jgi:hypothetical protein
MTNRIPLTEVVCVKARYLQVSVRRLHEEFSDGGGANEISQRRAPSIPSNVFHPENFTFIPIGCTEKNWCAGGIALLL